MTYFSLEKKSTILFFGKKSRHRTFLCEEK